MRRYHQVLRGAVDLARAEVGAVVQEELSKKKVVDWHTPTDRKGQGKGILYADGARTMVCRRQEDDAEAKIRRARVGLEHAEKKTARRDRNKKWKPVLQELKRKVRERNARLKQQQKITTKHVV